MSVRLLAQGPWPRDLSTGVWSPISFTEGQELTDGVQRNMTKNKFVQRAGV